MALGSELLQISPDEQRRAARTAALFSEEELTRFLQVMLRTFDELGYRQEQRFHFELGLLKLVHLRRLLPLEEVLSQSAGGARRAAASAAVRSAQHRPLAKTCILRQRRSCLATATGLLSFRAGQEPARPAGFFASAPISIAACGCAGGDADARRECSRGGADAAASQPSRAPQPDTCARFPSSCALSRCHRRNPRKTSSGVLSKRSQQQSRAPQPTRWATRCGLSPRVKRVSRLSSRRRCCRW